MDVDQVAARQIPAVKAATLNDLRRPTRAAVARRGSRRCRHRGCCWPCRAPPCHPAASAATNGLTSSSASEVTELRGAAGRRHAQQTGPRRPVRREHDRVVRGPRAAAQFRRVGQRLGRASRHRNLLQFAAGKKPDPLSIRGKERRMRVVGSSQRHRVQLIEPSHVQLRASLRALLCRRTRGRRHRERRQRRRRTASRGDQAAHRRPVRPRDGDPRPARARHGAHERDRQRECTASAPAATHGSPRGRGVAAAADAGHGGVAERVDLEPDVADVPDALLRAP